MHARHAEHSARRRLLIALFLPAIGALSVHAVNAAYAAPPESVPPECHAQVDTALKRLDAVLNGRRILVKGAAGTIERAIAAYVPSRFHAVEEGALSPRKSNASCPPDMALVDMRFCVDKWEASLVERLADGSTRSVSPYQVPNDTATYVATSVSGVVPQGYISAAQASNACRAASKRLCSPVEWRAACGGSEGYVYPYGPAHVVGKCKDTGATPMTTYHADSMSRGWGLSELNDSRNNQLDGGLARTGAASGCVNNYGVHDMVGNLDEWTADPNGTFQGGYWLDTGQHGEGCAYRTTSHTFAYHDYSTGFRCCAEPAGELADK